MKNGTNYTRVNVPIIYDDRVLLDTRSSTDDVLPLKPRTFQTRIDQRWELLTTEKVKGIDEEWSKVKGIFQETSEKTLGYRKSKEKAEWISEREHSSLWTREENTRTGEKKAQTW